MPTQIPSLIPGQTVTTRADVAAFYGGATQGGIVPSKDSGIVFVYSDRSSGEQYGYTFDGRTEDDVLGPLYLYTGAGAVGDQVLPGANQALLYHAQQGRQVHLFVADGVVPGTRKKWQRYIGQVVVDEVQPYEERRNQGRDGVERQVFVFRLRPAPGHELVFLPQDAVLPAQITSVIPVPTTPPVPPLPAPTGGLVSTEAHNTSTTTATITGGLIEVQRREGDLTDAFEAFLAAQGHQCQRFQLIVEGVGGSLKTDTYDVTDNVLYEAKGKSGREYVRMAIGQLLDYRRHAKQHVPAGLRLAVLLPEDPGQDLRDLIEGLGIALVFQDGDGFAGYPIA